jgi:hypothetical protein
MGLHVSSLRALVFVGASALCANGLAACGGGGNTPGAVPAPTSARAAARQTTLVNAARGTLTVVLSALETARYYGFYLRPGVGLALGAIAASPNPVCSPATHSASTALPNQTGTQTLVTTAYYPANDATCSQSPFRIVVMQYTLGAGGTQTGFGYQISYSNANDPVFGGSGVVAATDGIVTTIYKSANGSANLVASISPGAVQLGGVDGPPAQPPPGTFPATFPSVVLGPPAVTPFGFFFATAESGASSATSMGNLQGAFAAPASFLGGDYGGHVASSDDYAVTAAGPNARGDTALSLVDKAPLFITDVSESFAPTTTPPYPFAGGNTLVGIGQLSPLAYRSTAANIAAPVAATATYDASGQLVACSDSAADRLDGVAVTATCANGGASIGLTVTDLLAKKSAIAPATITLDTYGFSVAPFTFTIDGSVDAISGFTLSTSASSSS